MRVLTVCVVATTLVWGCGKSRKKQSNKPAAPAVDTSKLHRKVKSYLVERNRKEQEALRRSKYGEQVDTRITLTPIRSSDIGMMQTHRIRGLSGVALVQWYALTSTPATPGACAVIGAAVRCGSGWKGLQPLRWLVKRFGLGSQPRRLGKAAWVKLVTTLLNLRLYRPPKPGDQWGSRLREDFPYLPSKLEAQILKPSVTYGKSGGATVRIHHVFGHHSSRVVLDQVVVRPDNTVSHKESDVYHTGTPPSHVAERVLRHLRAAGSTQRKQDLVMHPQRLKIRGLWLVRTGRGKRFVILGEELRVLRGEWLMHKGPGDSGPHRSGYSAAGPDGDLTWLVAGLAKAKLLAPITWDQWLVLLEWIYKTRPLTGPSWLEKTEKVPAVMKQFHGARLVSAGKGSFRLEFFHHKNWGLLRTVVRIVPGKPVQSTTREVHKRKRPKDL